jgi:TorA maturation chaperone TorD
MEPGTYAQVAGSTPAIPTTDRETAELRCRTWTLLATLLRETPDAGVLERLAAVDAGDADSGDPLAAAWAGLRAAARRADPEPLDDEFHDLFIGLGRGELVPYGSWYRTGFLMDRPLVALRRDLQTLGFQRQETVCEPEDHAAALAEVMAMLADPQTGQDDSTQRLFFREHVDSWMPTLFADMQAARSADFYRAVGRLGEAFLDFERAWLQAAD